MEVTSQSTEGQISVELSARIVSVPLLAVGVMAIISMIFDV
jgi:hypothetical protein